MNDIDTKVHILLSAKNRLEKELTKQQKRVDKWSDKLFNADDSNSTVRRRANMRIRLSQECEERDRIQKKIRIIEDWVEELRGRE